MIDPNAELAEAKRVLAAISPDHGELRLELWRAVERVIGRENLPDADDFDSTLQRLEREAGTTARRRLTRVTRAAWERQSRVCIQCHLPIATVRDALLISSRAVSSGEEAVIHHGCWSRRDD